MERMPRSRTSGLVLKEVEGELLIYDLESNKAHCLNETAARIWRHCDGETTVAEACASLSKAAGSEFDQKLIWYALDQFANINLLDTNITPPASMIAGMNRRQMVRILGISALIAAPVVTTIIAPTPAQAATLLAPGSPCTSSSQCSSGLCACSVPGPGCVTTCQ